MRGHTSSMDPLPVQYHRLLGTRTGVIQEFLSKLPERSGPRLSITEPSATDHQLLPGHGYESPLSAAGKARSFQQSLLRTVGETVERYCLRFPPTDGLIEASYAELEERDGVEPIDFDYLDIFDIPEDAPFEQPLQSTSVSWAAGVDLLDGTERYVPAELVWFMDFSAEGAVRHFPATSNGVAAGPTQERAVLSAIYEAIERDGLVGTWLRQRTPTRIDTSQFPEVAAQLTELLDHESLSLDLSKLETLVDVPVVSATIADKRDRAPKFVIGGNAAGTWSETLIGGGIEAAQCFSHLRSYVGTDLEELSIDDTMTNFTDNARLYSKPELYDKVAFLTGKPGDAGDLSIDRPASMTPGEELEWCLAALDEADLTPIAFDLTTPDVRDVGIHVVRVFVPELLPLPFPSVPPSRHPRLVGTQTTNLPHPIP